MSCCNGRACEAPTSADDYMLDKHVMQAQYRDNTMKFYYYGGCPYKVRGLYSVSHDEPGPTFRYNRRVAPPNFKPDWWQFAPLDVYMLLNKMVLFLRKNPRTNMITLQYNQHQVTYDISFACRQDAYLVRAFGATNARAKTAALLPEPMLRVFLALLYLSRYDAGAPERVLNAVQKEQQYVPTGISWDDKYWQWKCPIALSDAPLLTQLPQLFVLLPRRELMGDDPCLDTCFISQHDATNLWVRSPRVVLHTVQADSVRADTHGVYQMILEQTHRYNFYPTLQREQHADIPSHIATPDLVHHVVLE